MTRLEALAEYLKTDAPEVEVTSENGVLFEGYGAEYLVLPVGDKLTYIEPSYEAKDGEWIIYSHII